MRIRAHLDESKAARYLSESSPAGRMVKDFAEKVQMSASELAEMIAATAELKSVSVGQADSDETRGQLADRMLKRYRTTLGDERFLQVAQEFNPIVSSIDPILADAQYDPAFRSELFLAYHQRIVSLRAQPREKRAELAAKVLDDLSNLKIADPVLAQKLRASPLWTALETYKKK